MANFIELPDIAPEHNEMHRFLFRNTLKFISEIASTPPTTDTLFSGWAQFYDDWVTGTRRLYVNIGGNLVYIEGKNV